MKHLAIVLCAASALLGGCAAEAEYWYQREANAPDFDVVKAECRAKVLATTLGIDCSAECQSEPAPSDNSAVQAGYHVVASAMSRRRCNQCLSKRNEVRNTLVSACLTRMGWSPCDEHVPECQ